jgi:hypothetical protein
MGWTMRRIFSVVVSLAFAMNCLSVSASSAAEKEEELLKAMEAIVQQYKADEGNQQQSTNPPPPTAAVEQQTSPALQQKTGETVRSQFPTVVAPPPAEQQPVQKAAVNPVPAASSPETVGNIFPQPSVLISNDDIINTIEEAVRQYRANDFAGAISNLDYATQLIRQKKSERMKALLPEPLPGWQAKPASAKFLGAAVFGGGSTVSRDYFTSNGAAISIEIVSDSPVLQSIIMMLNNPLFAGASGGNIQTVKQQRAMFKYNEQDHSGEINIVVAGRFIVTVKGRGIDQPSLLRYAESVDFEVLAKN